MFKLVSVTPKNISLEHAKTPTTWRYTPKVRTGTCQDPSLVTPLASQQGHIEWFFVRLMKPMRWHELLQQALRAARMGRGASVSGNFVLLFKENQIERVRLYSKESGNRRVPEEIRMSMFSHWDATSVCKGHQPAT